MYLLKMILVFLAVFIHTNTQCLAIETVSHSVITACDQTLRKITTNTPPEESLSIVVPLLGELGRLPDFLTTILNQRNIQPGELSLVFVVNNRRPGTVMVDGYDLEENARQENSLSMTLLAYASGAHIEGIERILESNPSFYVFTRLRESQIPIIILDRASSGREISRNIGLIRAIGIATVINVLRPKQPNHIIDWLDADSLPGPNYVRTIIDTFKNRPNTQAVFTPFQWRIEPGSSRIFYRASLHERLFWTHFYLENALHHIRGRGLFTGAPAITARSGAFQALLPRLTQLTIAEDTSISQNLTESEIHRNNRYTVLPQNADQPTLLTVFSRGRAMSFAGQIFMNQAEELSKIPFAEFTHPSSAQGIALGLEHPLNDTLKHLLRSQLSAAFRSNLPREVLRTSLEASLAYFGWQVPKYLLNSLLIESKSYYQYHQLFNNALNLLMFHLFSSAAPQQTWASSPTSSWDIFLINLLRHHLSENTGNRPISERVFLENQIQLRTEQANRAAHELSETVNHIIDALSLGSSSYTPTNLSEHPYEFLRGNTWIVPWIQEQLQSGKTRSEIMNELRDEFHDWFAPVSEAPFMKAIITLDVITDLFHRATLTPEEWPETYQVLRTLNAMDFRRNRSMDFR